MSLVAKRDTVTLHIPRLRDAWRLPIDHAAWHRLIAKFSPAGTLRVRLKTPLLPSVALSPHPGALLRAALRLRRPARV